MVASKYPLKNIAFELLDHMVFTEAMCPRGIFRVSIGEGEKETFIYSVHLQPLDGVSRAEARFKQLEQIKNSWTKTI